MVYNHNIPPKRKTKVKKLTGLELEEQRIDNFIAILMKKGSFGYREMKRVLKLGPGMMERLARAIKEEYSDTIKWDKETRKWKYTPLTLEQARAKKQRNELKSSPDIEIEGISIPIESKIVS